MSLTEKEVAILKAIDYSEYGDGLTDAIWMFSVQDNLDLEDNIETTSIPGIVSSLNKKGYVVSYNDGDDSTIRITEEGVEAYIAAIGKENVNKYVGE